MLCLTFKNAVRTSKKRTLEPIFFVRYITSSEGHLFYVSFCMGFLHRTPLLTWNCSSRFFKLFSFESFPKTFLNLFWEMLQFPLCTFLYKQYKFAIGSRALFHMITYFRLLLHNKRVLDEHLSVATPITTIWSTKLHNSKFSLCFRKHRGLRSILNLGTNGHIYKKSWEHKTPSK